MTRTAQEQEKDKARHRALDRVDAALRSLGAPWTVLRETGIAADGSRLGAAFVALHPDRGIALVDLASARPDAATTWLRVSLIRAGSGVFTVREPPIVPVLLSLEEIPHSASRIEASFSGIPPCALDKDWPEIAVASLTAQHVGLVSLRRDGAPEAGSEAQSPTDAFQHSTLRPAAESQAQPAPSDHVPPSEISVSPPGVARPPSGVAKSEAKLQEKLGEERRAEKRDRDQASRKPPTVPSREQIAAAGASEPVRPPAEPQARPADGPRLDVPRIDVPRYGTPRSDLARMSVPLPFIGSPALRFQRQNPPREPPEANASSIDAPRQPVAAPAPRARPSGAGQSTDVPKSNDAPIQIPAMPPPASEHAKDPPRAAVFAAEERGARSRTVLTPGPERDELKSLRRGAATTEPLRPRPPRPKLYAERDAAFMQPDGAHGRRRSPLWLVGGSALAAAVIMLAYPRETTGPEEPVARTAQTPAREAAPTIAQSDALASSAVPPGFGEPLPLRASPPSFAQGDPTATPQRSVVRPRETLREAAPAAPTPSLAENSAGAQSAARGAEAAKASKPASPKEVRSGHKTMLASNIPPKAEDQATTPKRASTKNASTKAARRPPAPISAGKDSEQAAVEDQDIVRIQGTEYIAGREPRPLGSLPSQTEVASAPAQPPPAEQPTEARSSPDQRPRSTPLPPNTDFAITPSGIMGPSGVVTPFSDR